MKIIESSIIGKKSQEACEDGMVVTDDFIAVIDGSTSKTPKHLNPDMKNGRYADRKSTRLNSSHRTRSRMPSSA